MNGNNNLAVVLCATRGVSRDEQSRGVAQVVEKKSRTRGETLGNTGNGVEFS